MSLYDIPVTTIDGQPATLAPYRGRTLLIVNVASKCGYTPQYEGLEDLHRRYQDKGLTVLGFPCDQFGHQEPGTAEEIQRFCAENYDVTFPLFAKIHVNGRNTHPLYALLKSAAPGIAGTESIKWNFTKFLVGPDGTIVKRYSSRATPQAIERDIGHMLT